MNPVAPVTKTFMELLLFSAQPILIRGPLGCFPVH